MDIFLKASTKTLKNLFLFFYKREVYIYKNNKHAKLVQILANILFKKTQHKQS